ncbi:type II secretion system protein [Sphingobium sp. H39-3-25]|uniref:type IV pilus modification PilV family protein n=1 Tax=Sphingobium TaxID=165695 RepID=UPI0023B8B8A7|nr:type II secretion system protein [Sphingobium arseniciresistens]
MKVAPSEAGFSLVETLVSLAVIAGMSAMLFDSVSTHALAGNRTAQKREAVLLARSLLAHASITSGPGELPESGHQGDLAWRYTHHTVRSEARDSAAALQQVRIDVLDRNTGRQLVRVETLRLDQ